MASEFTRRLRAYVSTMIDGSPLDYAYEHSDDLKLTTKAYRMFDRLRSHASRLAGEISTAKAEEPKAESKDGDMFGEALENYLLLNPELAVVREGFSLFKDATIRKGIDYAMTLSLAMTEYEVSNKDEQRRFFAEVEQNYERIKWQAKYHPKNTKGKPIVEKKEPKKNSTGDWLKP